VAGAGNDERRFGESRTEVTLSRREQEPSAVVRQSSALRRDSSERRSIVGSARSMGGSPRSTPGTARSTSGSSRSISGSSGVFTWVESLHRTLRKSLKVRGHFPSAEAASKLLYLALRNAEVRLGTRITGARRGGTSASSSGTASPSGSEPGSYTKNQTLPLGRHGWRTATARGCLPAALRIHCCAPGDPLYDEIRSETRCQHILQRVGLGKH
jgi:hypothetical protein